MLTLSLLLLISSSRISQAEEFDEFGDAKKPGTDSVFGSGSDSGGGGGGDDSGSDIPTVPKGLDACDGIYVTYNFISREKTYPHVKNVSAQSWAFRSQLQVMNMGITELKSWKVFIGFQHNEILVSTDGGILVDGDDFPAQVGNNGTTVAGYPKTDLKTGIETAGDMTQMTANVEFKGTQFGLKTGTPMPKSIKLVNDGFTCPAPTKKKTNMYMCCRKDKKFKPKVTKTKFAQRRYGDLNFMYDILQAYGNNYMAQVTIDNDHPLGRLDHWNLTWEWMRGEFIYSMRGAFTRMTDPSECVYGTAGQYYQDLDFSKVTNCQKKPIISDLPREMKDDDKLGKLPYCCRNGTILPKTMNESESRSIFQLQNWKINGVLNPQYKCGPAVRVDPTEFPDPSGLNAKTLAVATWQVVCNITKPKEKQSKCCVTFSGYYNESAIPCSTCACGCDDLPEQRKCSQKAPAMLLPPEALLVPFDNRTEKAKAWARIKHLPVYNPAPCPDNCGVSINWHVDSDYKSGWTARLTLFNWGDIPFENWFAAVQLGKASLGYEKVYSFNGTRLPEQNNTVFFQGLPGLNYLIAETNGSSPSEPKVPGKQQSVISFTKKLKWSLDVPGGDGFPTRVLFNGEECALPKGIPKKSGAHKLIQLSNHAPLFWMTIVTILMLIV
ncbi:COBRA-like protein 10 [Ancistrocladus abbreviatus]